MLGSVGAWFIGKSPLGMIKAAAPYLLVLAFVLAMWGLWSTNQKLNKEIGSVRGQLEQAVSANETNQKSIEKYDGLLKACNDKFELATTNNRIAVAKLNSDYEALSNQKDRVHVELKEIFKAPSCDELGKIDINAVCPALATELRSIANSIDRN